MPRSRNIVPVVLAFAVIGQEAGAQRSTLQIRDSAGVSVVTQRPGAVVPLIMRPRFTVNGTEGGREPFHRINGVLALRDGFVVANAGTHELRFYGRGGEPGVTAGRQGGGPGEFQFLSWIQAYRGDSLVTYDARQRRLAVWGASGKHSRDIPVMLGRTAPGPGTSVMAPSPLGLLSGDQLIYVGSAGINPAPTMQRVAGTLVSLKPTTQRHDSITRVGVFDVQFAVADDGRPLNRQVAFPRQFSAAFGSTEYSISEGVEHRIDRYSSDGRLMSSIRVQRAAAPVTRRDRDEYLSEVDAEERTNVVFGPILPAYDALWYDREGRLWAGHFRAPSAAAGQWDVFDARGRLIVTVSAPPSLRLVAADATQVYAIHTDDLEVPTVQAFDLPPILKH